MLCANIIFSHNVLPFFERLVELSSSIDNHSNKLAYSSLASGVILLKSSKDKFSKYCNFVISKSFSKTSIRIFESDFLNHAFSNILDFLRFKLSLVSFGSADKFLASKIACHFSVNLQIGNGSSLVALGSSYKSSILIELFGSAFFNIKKASNAISFQDF
jgi:hypothetical protein